MGLSISYSIVRKHHGEILMESPPGKGTAFIVALPLEPNVTKAHAASSLPSREREPAPAEIANPEKSTP